MAESSTPVRLLQHHLRQSGMLMAAGQLDAAAAQLEAALAIDPASLAALALRERLSVLRASNSGPASNAGMRATTVPAPVPTESAPAPAADRFVPNGVNAASWTDFEQRVQQRRFRALIETGDRAIASGDMTAARNAMEEARELQPDSLEVSRLAIRLAAMPRVAAENAKRDGLFGSRTFRAASLLLLGVSLLMGLDWVRSDEAGAPTSTTAVGTGGLDVEEIADGGKPPAAMPEAVAERSEATPDITPADDVGVTTETPTPTPATPTPAAAPTPTASATLQPQRVNPPVMPPARELPPGEISDSYVALPANRLAGNAVTTSPIVNGEIPDNYVAPARRASSDARERPDTPAVAAGRAGTPATIANVVRQPATTIETLGTSGATSSPLPLPSVSPAPVAPAAAPAAAVIVPPQNENARVQSVLDQYASAYGRLDVGAVRTVWPSVNQRSLTKAFSDLNSQQLTFDGCTISLESASSAKASCRGKTRFVPKVGSQVPRTESRTVHFELRRDGDAWKIQKAETGR